MNISRARPNEIGAVNLQAVNPYSDDAFGDNNDVGRTVL